TLMNWNSLGQWNDMPNSFAGTFRGIIEIPQTPPTFTYNGNEYQLTSSGQTWEQAQAAAESLGGNLVVIDDVAEQNWLRQTFGNTERFWIGLSDRNQEGNFQWVNGDSSTYRNWAPGEPNDYKFNGNFTAGEDYTLMNWNSSGQWNDMPNSFAGTFRGIIELGNNSNNPGVIGLETSIYQVNEADGTAEITVLRTEGSDGIVSIDYATVDASATSGTDFTAASGTLTFANGETSKTVTIAIQNDSLAEGNEEFGFTLDNIVGDATLLAPRTALVTIVDDETGLEPIIDFDNFTDTATLTINGNAAPTGDVLRLTSSGANQAGSTFFDRPLAIDSNTSFATQFQFQISGGSGGADGFTFILQNDAAGLNSLGYRGGDLGYASEQNTASSGIAQSLAIEFDTYRNSWDDNNNHLSILRDGSVRNPLTTVAAPLDLNSGSLLNAWIDYDGTSNLLSVFLGNTADKPTTALLSQTIDLALVLGSQAFIGFSAGTGGLSNNHDLINWELTSNSTLLAAPPSSVALTSETIVSGLNQPTAIEWTPTGDRFFVAEKGGVIKVSQNGQLQSTPFIDLSAQVNGTRDRGLLDIAVHPEFFDGSPYVYALYTYDPPEVFQNTGLAGADGNGNRAARLTRITADASTNFTTAVPGSEVVILGTNSTWNNFNAFANSTNNFNEPPAGILADGSNLQDFLAADSESHTIGSVEFGPDGALYVSNGDGTSYNQVDPRTVRVQDIDNLSGKILRIDPITGDGLADNPFYNGDPDANRSKVYQLGLRNPFRITVDPRNGDVYVGDVGWTQWEEINSAGAGANFGWPYYEGGSGNSLRTGGYQNLPEAQAFYNSGQSVNPSILALNHGADGINAIVLGDIYTGNAFPEEYRGDLFFSDLGQGIVYNVSFNDQGEVIAFNTFTTGANVVVQIIEAPDGSLYYVDLDDGIVGRWFFD
ncbi:MAG: PQQ-dependent sugar dehydrogenase, partial [Cyanobacteria bacterium J06638_38]